MNTNIKTAAKLAAFAGAFALTGCAFVPDTVHPTYTPPANVTKVPGADKVVVDVIVKNEKKHHDQVSYVINGYGFKTASVSMDVSKDFKNAIEAALKARGYKVSASGNAKLVVVVNRFFLVPSNSAFTENQNGSAVLSLDVINAQKNTIYSKRIDCHYKESGMFISYHEGPAKHLMNKVINKIFADQKLLAALSKTKDVTVPRIALH